MSTSFTCYQSKRCSCEEAPEWAQPRGARCSHGNRKRALLALCARPQTRPRPRARSNVTRLVQGSITQPMKVCNHLPGRGGGGGHWGDTTTTDTTDTTDTTTTNSFYSLVRSSRRNRRARTRTPADWKDGKQEGKSQSARAETFSAKTSGGPVCSQ